MARSRNHLVSLLLLYKLYKLYKQARAHMHGVSKACSVRHTANIVLVDH